MRSFPGPGGGARVVAAPLPSRLIAHDFVRAGARPRLLFFYSEKSGRCRRVEDFLALLLQRRRNHRTFNIIRVPLGDYPELADRFEFRRVPTLLVVQERRVVARLDCPGGVPSIESAVRPWLR